MSSELKPCPLCGGDAYAVEYVSALKETRIKSVVGLGGIEHKEPYEAVLGAVIVGLAGCSSCRAQVEAHAKKDDKPGTAKAAAIEAWNTRAERTCHITGDGKDNDPKAGWVCSACGFKVPYGCEDFISFNYCSHCGTKAVDE